MLSIWSDKYLQFKKCNPFHASNPKKDTQQKSLPCTLGQTKVIATSKLQLATSQSTRITTSAPHLKRKLDTINDENTEEDGDEESLKRQKSRNDDIKSSIDNMLSQYGEINSHECAGSATTTQSTQDSAYASSYFSSSSKSQSRSPILNKVRKKKRFAQIKSLSLTSALFKSCYF